MIIYAKVKLYNYIIRNNINLVHKYYTIIIIYKNYTFVMVPADLPAGMQKLYGQLHSFQILNTFLYDFCVGL